MYELRNTVPERSIGHSIFLLLDVQDPHAIRFERFGRDRKQGFRRRSGRSSDGERCRSRFRAGDGDFLCLATRNLHTVFVEGFV